MKFIVEHLEKPLSQWCFLEYQHIITALGKDAVFFTNVDDDSEQKQLAALGVKVYKETVANLIAQGVFPKEKCVLIDLDDKGDLTPQEAPQFEYAIFGGILGDQPLSMRSNTHFSSLHVERRQLTDKQMSTDTSVLVCDLVANKQQALSSLHFAYEIDITLNEFETMTLPYQYLLVGNTPVFTPGLVEHLQQEGWE